MIAEKSNTAQQLIDRIIPTAGKVGFISDDTLSKALLFLEKNGFPTHKTEDYKYCNMDAILKKEFKELAQNFVQVKELAKFKLEDTITMVVVNGVFSEELSDK